MSTHCVRFFHSYIYTINGLLVKNSDCKIIEKIRCSATAALALLRSCEIRSIVDNTLHVLTKTREGRCVLVGKSVL